MPLIPDLRARAPVLSANAMSTEDDGNSTSSIVAGSVVGGVLALLLVGVFAWWIRRRTLRARADADERGRGGAGVVESLGGSTRPTESPERKFARFDPSPSAPSSKTASPRLSLNPLPLLLAEGKAPSGMGPHTVNGRPVSNAGVVGNINSTAYSPANTRRLS